MLADNDQPTNKFILPPSLRSVLVNDTMEKMYADEKGMKLLLEKVRKYYYDKGLVGSLEISRSYLMAESSLSIDIDGTQEYEDEKVQETQVKVHKKVDAVVDSFLDFIVTGTTSAINKLMNRAKVYAGKSYADDMSLSLSMSWSDPQGIFGVSIGCSVTVASILEHIYREHEFEMSFGFDPVEF
ncbi:hypothetical protein B484DRAFT_449224 [Ochromonadaceae sp. CCMP2298]|nr:hypothetical protein B484DRAFT_449224 [Ochromonadaceae sp. CCMP2298]|mmetsp:Transcript_6074/g.13266  ORF Transcript_6074/g.13266 Transcript_6074/m.13266 type:complete len:184 (+) Transcript_6074:102-653(+)